MKTPYLRIYFNNNREVSPEQTWSFDTGPNTVEGNCREIRIVDAPGRTKYDPKLTPCAWIEFFGVDAWIEKGVLVVVKG